MLNGLFRVHKYGNETCTLNCHVNMAYYNRRNYENKRINNNFMKSFDISIVFTHHYNRSYKAITMND